MIKNIFPLLCTIFIYNSLQPMQGQLKKRITCVTHKESCSAVVDNITMSKSVETSEINKYSFEVNESPCCLPIHLLIRAQISCADVILQTLKKMNKEE